MFFLLIFVGSGCFCCCRCVDLYFVGLGLGSVLISCLDFGSGIVLFELSVLDRNSLGFCVLKEIMDYVL